MRYHELLETRLWKTFRGQIHPCLIASQDALEPPEYLIVEAEAHFGPVFIGKTMVFQGYFVRIVSPLGEDWLAEDPYSMRVALQKAAEVAEQNGWSLLAIGLSNEWRESGLSANTGYGSHPDHPDRAVHMLERGPRNQERAVLREE